VPLTEAVAGYELIDTKEVPWQTPVVEEDEEEEDWEGVLKVAYPYGMSPNERHFYLSCVVDVFQNKFDNDDDDDNNYNKNSERIFNQLIEHDWSILGLSENKLSYWFRYDHRWQPYLRKLCEFWDVFCSEGERYIGAGLHPTTLWRANGALMYILANMGVPHEERHPPHHPTDLKGFCEKYNLLTVDVLNR
jgi:hypothetical protein